MEPLIYTSKCRQPLTPETPSLGTVMAPLPEILTGLPPTPPFETHKQATDASTIASFNHVLTTEAKALSQLSILYQSDPHAQHSLCAATNLITRVNTNGGNLIFCGVGKSGKIAEKLVATMTSFGIHSNFLHPIEALHGDLGMIKPNDAIIFITFSGRTPELINLLTYLPPNLPMVAITSNTACPLLADRDIGILLPAPIPESEATSFGVSAPTTSTTVAIALGDALALAVARRLHEGRQSLADVFNGFHPGGAIGADAQSRRMADIATMVEKIPIARPAAGHSVLKVMDVVLTAIRAPGGWVRVSEREIISPRRIQRFRDMEVPFTEMPDTIIRKEDWISILANSTVDEAKTWIHRMRLEERGRGFLKPGTILGIVDAQNEVSGVLEIEDLMGDDFTNDR
ncbi:MAG: hypothetical protein M1812_006484 [Candelaria pacifica]|nr:MAG: hypothetical protein M1812_006484 [Candelaria pacifica]